MWEQGKLRRLGTLGGSKSQAIDINDRGQVLGWSWTKSEKRKDARGFLCVNGRMIDLGAVFAPAALNNRGQIVGHCGDQACVWQTAGSRSSRSAPTRTAQWTSTSGSRSPASRTPTNSTKGTTSCSGRIGPDAPRAFQPIAAAADMCGRGSLRLSESISGGESRDFSPIRRRGGDSNSRGACTPNGFRDRRIRPLCHPSAAT